MRFLGHLLYCHLDSYASVAKIVASEIYYLFLDPPPHSITYEQESAVVNYSPAFNQTPSCIAFLSIFSNIFTGEWTYGAESG